MQRRVDLVAERYDMPTRIWTCVLGVSVAAIINWFALYVPTHDHPPEPIHTPGWFAALIVAVAPPASWLVGRITDRDGDGIVLWSCAVVFVVVTQIVLLVWASS